MNTSPMLRLTRPAALMPLLLWLAACSSMPDSRQASQLWQSPAVSFAPGTPVAERIVQIAQREHTAWHAPFMDVQGRLLSRRVAEAESKPLQDGSRAWERVAAYWRDSGTLHAVAASRNGARQCLQPSAKMNRDACRSFVMDVPWSAAFVSYVMVQAGVPQFTASPGHIHYIRAAWQQRGPYTLQDPEQTAVAAGDMLCYIRNHPQIEGYQGLRAFLAVGNEWLPAHCDIVVAIRGQEAWLVGGNVSNTVAMRKLPLDGQGRALLPRPPGAGNTNPAAACSPENEAACNMNRQNWAALLQLKPETP